MRVELSLELLKQEAKIFSQSETERWEPRLFGITDGKAIGTYFEHKFLNHLRAQYYWEEGSSAKGIDFPNLMVDVKVTSIKQPQSSCPFKSARQKIYGLGYSLLIFVYDKEDDVARKLGRLKILHTIFVQEDRTGDYQTTVGIRQILENQGNLDDIVAFLEDRFLPTNEIERQSIAEEIVAHPPNVRYLTISNALQWRLQYRRVIETAGEVDGIVKVW
mgnify:CR=1 FL=1